MSKTPKLASVTKVFDQFLTDIEKDAGALLNQIQGADAHRANTFKKANEKLTAKRQELTGVEQYLDELDKLTNGGPTEEDSDGSSGTSHG